MFQEYDTKFHYLKLQSILLSLYQLDQVKWKENRFYNEHYLIDNFPHPIKWKSSRCISAFVQKKNAINHWMSLIPIAKCLLKEIEEFNLILETFTVCVRMCHIYFIYIILMNEEQDSFPLSASPILYSFQTALFNDFEFYSEFIFVEFIDDCYFLPYDTSEKCNTRLFTVLISFRCYYADIIIWMCNRTRAFPLTEFISIRWNENSFILLSLYYILLLFSIL